MKRKLKVKLKPNDWISHEYSQCKYMLYYTIFIILSC